VSGGDGRNEAKLGVQPAGTASVWINDAARQARVLFQLDPSTDLPQGTMLDKAQTILWQAP
jgi:hypothetical protein